MKYTLKEIFDDIEPQDINDLLSDDIGDKLPKKALRRIERSTAEKVGIKTTKRRFNYKIFAPVAACMLLTTGLGGYVIAADVKEYNDAVSFFEENGLSAEGLSRSDVKAVYRDITANRFTNSMTAEVIRRSVPGVEILQEEPTPEDLATLWNSNVNTLSGSHLNDVEYHHDLEMQSGAEYYEWDYYVLECIRDGETLWKIKFPTLGKNWGDDEFSVSDCVMTSAGTAAWGERTHYTVRSEDSISCSIHYAWLARIDDSGNKLWQKEFDHGFESEYIKAVLDNGDGTWAVISEGDNEYLCLSQFDINGNEISSQKTKIERINIRNAARLGDGYLVQVDRVYTDEEINEGKHFGGGNANLIKLDHDGNLTDKFVYESDDCEYRITDMAEFEGKVYLSAYAIPKQDGFGEMGDIIDDIFSKGSLVISPEELTPIVRDNYTAVLLLCDPNSGEPGNFYSAKGALGGALSVEDGALKWNAESIVSAFYSPYTSSFSIGGSCKVYQYSFNKDGILTECDDTGEAVSFSR